MKIIKSFLLLILLLISNTGYSSQVIPPGLLLTIISKNNTSIKELRSNWIIKDSDLLKNSSDKELLSALKLLIDVDIKTINPNLWENKIQIVKTKEGQLLEIKFKYTKYDYGPNDIALAGAYSLVSVKNLEANITGKQFLGVRGNFAKIVLGNEVCFIESHGQKKKDSFRIEFKCNGISQILFDTEKPIEGGKYTVDDPLFSLLWAGDKDNDGKIDIVMEMSPKYSYSKKITYLTSKAKAGQLVGIANIKKNESF